MSLPRVESFELQDMKSFITASEQDGDDGEAWHDACSAATSTSFASARGWVSCSEASFRSIRGSACSAAQGAVTVQDAAAAKVSQPDAPSPKAAAPMREPPIVDAEELPTCKRARSREDILQVVRAASIPVMHVNRMQGCTPTRLHSLAATVVKHICVQGIVAVCHGAVPNACSALSG